MELITTSWSKGLFRLDLAKKAAHFGVFVNTFLKKMQKNYENKVREKLEKNQKKRKKKLINCPKTRGENRKNEQRIFRDFRALEFPRGLIIYRRF